MGHFHLPPRWPRLLNMPTKESQNKRLCLISISLLFPFCLQDQRVSIVPSFVAFIDTIPLVDFFFFENNKRMTLDGNGWPLRPTGTYIGFLVLMGIGDVTFCLYTTHIEEQQQWERYKCAFLYSCKNRVKSTWKARGAVQVYVLSFESKIHAHS